MFPQALFPQGPQTRWDDFTKPPKSVCLLKGCPVGPEPGKPTSSAFLFFRNHRENREITPRDQSKPRAAVPHRPAILTGVVGRSGSWAEPWAAPTRPLLATFSYC